MSFDIDKFTETCSSKINQGDIIYKSVALYIAKRFNVKIHDYCYAELPNCVYHILNYYIDNVEGVRIDDWLNQNDAPLIRGRKELRKIFPELKFIDDDSKLIKIVNNIYNLDLKLDGEYFYTMSMDFESFVPIKIDEIIILKNDISVLKKYGYPTGELEEKLNEYGLTLDELEFI